MLGIRFAISLPLPARPAVAAALDELFEQQLRARLGLDHCLPDAPADEGADRPVALAALEDAANVSHCAASVGGFGLPM